MADNSELPVAVNCGGKGGTMGPCPRSSGKLPTSGMPYDAAGKIMPTMKVPSLFGTSGMKDNSPAGIKAAADAKKKANEEYGAKMMKQLAARMKKEAKKAAQDAQVIG